MKDNFSCHSDKYAKYRPTYPLELFEYINSIVPNKGTAWDCGTGNGQVAFELSKTFNQVFATDISQQQIDNAMQAENILYSVQPAEQTNFSNAQFDLVIVAQAIHWFDFEKFYTEVKRVAKPAALLCVIGYGLNTISKDIDKLVVDFYQNTIGKYWDEERNYLDDAYTTIPFPFEEIQTPTFSIKLHWTQKHFIEYLNTWSAVKHFIKHNNFNPVNDLQEHLAQHWQANEEKEITFPLFLRVGKVV